MKTVIVIQARMGSTRLPGKVLMPLGADYQGHLDQHVLGWCITAATEAGGNDIEVVVATSTLPADNKIHEFCMDWCTVLGGIRCVRGSESDVLDRFVVVAEKTGADVLVRLTGDCPFHDPAVIRQVIALREATGSDYASNIDPATWPDGLDVEVFTRRALMEAHRDATRASDRDCVTRYISRNRHRFKAVNLTCPLPGMHKERWVLDTADDYKFCQQIASRIKTYPPSYLDILDILKKEPELREINAHHPRNERFYEALATEKQEERICPTSKDLLEVAETYIPLGTQTFSKSKLQYPVGAPFFVTHGDGAYVYDVDGNDYVDLVSGLLPNILGYRDPDVDQAIRDQLDRGISFSMSTTLEADLAARLANYIPCAEMSRFGKTGTDVTTAAIRLARAYSINPMIIKAKAGYHGWAAWSTCCDPMRRLGTEEDGGLVGWFEYGNMELIYAFEEYSHPGAIIVEPETNPEFLRDLRQYCTDKGIILIFDEIITGFRFGMGGAQKYWGITPDLACFGKSMANGMPISALVGKKEIMKLMEKVCFSGTFFGETLSLAAAIATIDKLDLCNVPDYLTKIGRVLWERVLMLIDKHGLMQHIQGGGHPSLIRLTFKDPRVRALFMEYMIEEGVLIIASHNVNYAMKEPELNKIVKAYDVTLERLKNNIDLGYLDGVKPIAPTVRGAA